MIKLSHGLDSDGSLVHINDAQRGLACGLTCPCCDRPVIARQSKKGYAWHFAHKSEDGSEAECAHATETAIHLMAKDVIEARKKIPVPTTFDKNSETVIKQVSSVEVEGVRMNRRPDIVVNIGGEEVYVEIAVTHFCDDSKVFDYNRRKVNAIEIDLSDYATKAKSKSETVGGLIFGAVSRASWLSVNPTSKIASKLVKSAESAIRSARRAYEEQKAIHGEDLQELERTKQELERLRDEVSGLDRIYYLKEEELQEEFDKKRSDLQQSQSNLRIELRRLSSQVVEAEHKIEESKAWKRDRRNFMRVMASVIARDPKKYEGIEDKIKYGMVDVERELLDALNLDRERDNLNEATDLAMQERTKANVAEAEFRARKSELEAEYSNLRESDRWGRLFCEEVDKQVEKQLSSYRDGMAMVENAENEIDDKARHLANEKFRDSQRARGSKTKDVRNLVREALKIGGVEPKKQPAIVQQISSGIAEIL